jgi:ribosomal protein L1
MSIRKFLKMVGVHSQREIETAVERAMAAGKLKGSETLNAKMRLTVDGVDLDVSFDGKISLE